MYMTSQRKRLLLFFDSHPDHSFSAQEIYQILSSKDKKPVSISAIYRNLSALAKAGLVTKAVPQNSQEAKYRYVNSLSCKGKLHMICSCCGRTFHADKDTADSFLKAVLAKDEFLINPSQVTIYGLCRECREKVLPSCEGNMS